MESHDDPSSSACSGFTEISFFNFLIAMSEKMFFFFLARGVGSVEEIKKKNKKKIKKIKNHLTKPQTNYVGGGGKTMTSSEKRFSDEDGKREV